MIRHGLLSLIRQVDALPAMPPIALPSPTADQMDEVSHDLAYHLCRKRLQVATTHCLNGHRSGSSRHPGISRKPKTP